MFTTQLEQIKKQKSKALSVFMTTRDNLKDLITKADKCLNDNKDMIQQINNENDEIQLHINEMVSSVTQITTIIGDK